ncbi:MAG TPA: hypothetical protein VMD78_13545 [Candidatus Baltobacteraceae bacterium]|nr:hypothetical protein [Candidatus Baltobacteraceae bacterium]
MSVKTWLIVGVALISALPASAGQKKQKDVDRGMLEKMEAVPCGAKQRGLSGLGTLWASAGITHVNSDEKLCPQYLLRTDQMDYEIRPMDLKHATILPVGQEAQFRMKNKDMILDVPEAGLHKMRAYEVVAMNPNNNPDDDNAKSSSLTPDDDR